MHSAKCGFPLQFYCGWSKCLCVQNNEKVNTMCGQYAAILMVKTGSRDRLKRDGTSAVTRFGLSAKRTSPFKSAGESVQSTTGSRGVRISGRLVYFRCTDDDLKQREISEKVEMLGSWDI